MTAGLLPEDTGPAAHDTHLAEQAKAASQVHEAAEKELRGSAPRSATSRRPWLRRDRRAEDADRDVSGPNGTCAK